MILCWVHALYVGFWVYLSLSVFELHLLLTLQVGLRWTDVLGYMPACCRQTHKHANKHNRDIQKKYLWQIHHTHTDIQPYYAHLRIKKHINIRKTSTTRTYTSNTDTEMDIRHNTHTHRQAGTQKHKIDVREVCEVVDCVIDFMNNVVGNDDLFSFWPLNHYIIYLLYYHLYVCIWKNV